MARTSTCRPGVWRRLVRNNAHFIAIELRRAADQLDAAAPGSPSVAFIVFSTGGPISMSEITVPDTSGPLEATVKFLDSKGYETTADDTPVWSSSAEDVATVEASDDGLSATVTVAAPGATVIEVRTTNDDGSEAISQGTVTVQPGDAVIGEVSFTQ